MADVARDQREELSTLITNGTELTAIVNSQERQITQLLGRLRVVSAALRDRDAEIVRIIDDFGLVVHRLAERRAALRRLLEETNRTSKTAADLVGDKRAQLDTILDEVHTDAAIINRHQLDLAEALAYAGDSILRFSSITYAGEEPVSWGQVLLTSLGPAGNDVLFGCAGLLDRQLDLVLGPDPRTCRQQENTTPFEPEGPECPLQRLGLDALARQGVGREGRPSRALRRHVVATLAIRRGARVPTDSSVVILRRTLVGEQGVDLRAKGTTHTFYQPGETIRADHVQLPVDIQQLIQRANDVLGPVKPRSAATTVHELAEAVRGRRDELRSILVDAADLSKKVADHGADYDRLFRASRVVNAELAEHRETLARLVTQTADTTDVLRRIRQDFDGLLDQAPPVLSTVDRVVGRSQANLSCTLDDLGATMTFLARPEQLDNAAGALRANQRFFVGFSIIAPEDLDGRTLAQFDTCS